MKKISTGILHFDLSAFCHPRERGVHGQELGRGQKKTLWNWFSSSIFTWVLGIKLRLFGLYLWVASTFSYQASLLALSVCFILRLFYSSLFGWSETPYIDQAGFNLIGIHLPLGLHVRVTTPNDALF